jgi:hypothetical protein
MASRPNIYFVCGLPRSGTTAAIRGIRSFPNAYAIPYELALPEILYRLNYVTDNPSFKPGFEGWLWRHFDQVAYRHDNDPDQHPYDSRLLVLYRAWIEKILFFVGNSTSCQFAANSCNAFFEHITRETSCQILVEKTPSTALYIEQARFISKNISLIACIREPTAFLQSCTRRSALASQYERGGFEGGYSSFRNELIFYFSMIREALRRNDAYLIHHECLAHSPRTACCYLHSILFGKAPDLGTLNRFNDVVGGGLVAPLEQRLSDYVLSSSLFAELGYAYASEAELALAQSADTSCDHLKPLYGMTQTPGSWIKVNERFQAAFTRNSCDLIELYFLRDCTEEAMSNFQFKAVACDKELPIIFKTKSDQCIICINVESIGVASPILLQIQASSIIGNFLLNHCSEDVFYNIITNIELR